VGASALAANSIGVSLTALGYQTLLSNTTGIYSTAVGESSLRSNTTGSNTGVGTNALYANTTGTANVALGGYDGTAAAPLRFNTTGNYNTALGDGALGSNTTASNNTAVGYQAGTASTGIGNQFFGYSSGSAVTTGAKNVILGSYTGFAAPISATGSNFVVLSDGDGNIVASTKTANTFALPGGTLSTGAGIAFPATQSASTDANTLDDYEEGTWTPTIFGATTAGTTTYTLQVGSYTKIGRKVFCNLQCTWSAQTGTGSLKIGGLPFACSAAMPVAAFIIFNGTINPANASGAAVQISATTILCYVFVAGVSGATYAQFSYDV
jgi:hypothetical protein